MSQEETVKGRIAPGQYADFAVLSADYLTVPEEQIKNIQSLLTVVAGKVVYAAKPFDAFAPPAPGCQPRLVAGGALWRLSASATRGIIPMMSPHPRCPYRAAGAARSMARCACCGCVSGLPCLAWLGQDP